MTVVAFNSPIWDATGTFTGMARTLVPVLQRLQASQDWSKADATASDWLALRQEVVEGVDVSPAATLVLPWIVKLAHGRSPAELVQPWLTLGELEIARLVGRRQPAPGELLEEAAEVASGCRQRGLPSTQAELATAVCLLPRVPEWARLLLLRLVVLGQRFGTCPRCEELLDVVWDGSWRVGGCPVEPLAPGHDRRLVLAVIREEAELHGAESLKSIDGLSGVAQCAECHGQIDIVKVLATPHRAPE